MKKDNLKIIDSIKNKILVNNLLITDELKKSILAYIDNVKSKYSDGGCLILGCPKMLIDDILLAISNEFGGEQHNIDFNNIKKEMDLAAVLTNAGENSILTIQNIDKNKYLLNILCDSIIKNEMLVVIGKGPAAGKKPIPLGVGRFIIIANNKKDVPIELLEKIYSVIDFSKQKKELKKSIAQVILKKQGITLKEDALEIISNLNMLESDFIEYIYEIRNKAYNKNVKEVTIDLIVNNNIIPGIDIVNTMDGREFELFSGKLFLALGYEDVTVTQSSHDFGADVIAVRDNVRFAIQCKRYGAPVGVSAVQEVLASKSLHDCHVACILTNNTFTMAAEELARKNNVVLWGSDKLKEFIEKANQKSNS